MSRSILTLGLAGMTLITSAGCMSFCDPCGTYASGPYMPMDSRYCGAVDRGPLGGPQTKAAQKREMRRALRNAGYGACPTCNVGFDADPMMGGYAIDGGFSPAMTPPMMGGSSCPTCQGQGHISQFPPAEMGTHGMHMHGAPMHGMPMQGMPMMEHDHQGEMMGPEMMPHQHQMGPSVPGGVPQMSPMNVPVPMMEPTLETPSPAPSPAPTPAPGGPSANGTSQFYPTGMSPIYGGMSSYQSAPSASAPPAVQSFRPGASPVSYQMSADPMMTPAASSPTAQPMLTVPY